MPASKTPASTDAYIASFPETTQKKLNELRALIKKSAPGARETISYAMPAFELNGVLVYFAGYKTHIGFYATPTGHAAFKSDLAKYKTGKGSVQFPLDEPLPAKLITKMVKFRVAENKAKAASRTKKIPVAKRDAFSRLSRARQVMPANIKTALTKSGLMPMYKARPAYQQNDYLSWISRAARPETKEKRLAQMLDELKRGGVYMKMKWNGNS